MVSKRRGIRVLLGMVDEANRNGAGYRSAASTTFQVSGSTIEQAKMDGFVESNPAGGLWITDAGKRELERLRKLK